MKRLAIACGLLLFGCGADPDDYVVQEPDGCKSDDTECQAKVEEEEEEETAETETEVDEDGNITIKNEIDITVNNGTSIKNPTLAYAKCNDGKLCRGMTKEEVLSIIGSPDTTDVEDGVEYWEWGIGNGEGPYCHKYRSCELVFINGKLSDHEDMKSTWIDIIHW